VGATSTRVEHTDCPGKKEKKVQCGVGFVAGESQRDRPAQGKWDILSKVRVRDSPKKIGKSNRIDEQGARGRPTSRGTEKPGVFLWENRGGVTGDVVEI